MFTGRDGGVVQQDDPFVLRRLDPHGDRKFPSGPGIRRILRHGYDAKYRGIIALDGFEEHVGIVERAVVHHHDLELGVFLRQERRDERPQGFQTVAADHYHRDTLPLCRRGRGRTFPGGRMLARGQQDEHVVRHQTQPREGEHPEKDRICHHRFFGFKGARRPARRYRQY